MDWILIIDFGSQYTQLIARKIREQNIYCRVLSCFENKIEDAEHLKGIFLSGGPSSVADENAPEIPDYVFDLKLPILGICYGLQGMIRRLGGVVRKSSKQEYGPAELKVISSNILFRGLPRSFQVWMSHGDSTLRLPKGCKCIASTKSLKYAAVYCKEKRFYGLQFHPEVYHTEYGGKIIYNFAVNICGTKRHWTAGRFVNRAVKQIKDEVGGSKVICALSGGVDSAVCATLLSRAVGKNAIAVFIDNGLLRKNEGDDVERAFATFNSLKFKRVNASDIFLKRLKGVKDPERKRKIIGRTFIKVFDGIARSENVEYLAQGTLYPDLIESKSFKGPSTTIKSHHNVGGLPKRMKLKIVEPLKDLFKDEVRSIGKSLGLPKKFLMRHPFPGPGLAVRIIGRITTERLQLLREADDIFISELKHSKQYDKIWQAFCVLLPIKSVGVMGDERSYEYTIALRAVTGVDGMTADWAKLPNTLLERIASRITGEVKGVNRVVYDITSKPPATIEWE